MKLPVHTSLGYRFLSLYPENMSDVISLHEGRFLSLREIDDWEYATRPNATGVVGIFALTTAEEVILVEQYRRPVQARVLEICAGLVGDEEEFADESLADCAARELLEETGHSAGRITHLLSSPTSAGMTDETTHLFLARGCQKIAPGGGIGGEDITTHLVPLNDLHSFLDSAPARGLLVDFKIHACLALLPGNGPECP
jgi:ADP-ribose pyrophosphatase